MKSGVVIEISRRQFFALFARGAHGAKNSKKCRGPCGPPAGVRPCASKERRGGFRIKGAQACGMESGMGAGASGHGMRFAGGCWGARGVLCRDVGAGTEARFRVAVPRPYRDGTSQAAHGRYERGIAGGEMLLHMERLRCCATRPLREGCELMLSHEEKLERLELLDAVADAGRLAKGLDQLLESLAHADQLDPLDVEGILALRSISERCAERIGDAARILEAQNEVLYAEERANAKPRENER